MHKILLADDEAFNHEIIKRFLKKQDYNCSLESAYNGHDAIKMSFEQDFDLIIIDALMPGLDGFETARKIRQLEKEFTPILMLTALTDDESRIKAQEVNINDFLIKPIDFLALDLSIRNFLELKKLFKESNSHQKFYKSLIDSLSDSIVLFNQKGEITFSNNMGKKLLENLNLDQEKPFESLIQKFPQLKTLKELLDNSGSSPISQNQVYEFELELDSNYYQLFALPMPDKESIVINFKDFSAFYEKTSEMEYFIEKQKGELKKAVFIQKNLMSKRLPLNRKVQVRSLYVPSTSIGGDFHGIYKKNEFIAGFIADISGHGVEAALYGTLLYMIVENLNTLIFKDTGEFLETLDKELVNFNMDYNFITALAFRFDSKNNIISYANAGHNVPYYTVNGKKEKIPFPLEQSGPPLGLGMNLPYPEHSLEIEAPEFRILFYTDGLVEDFLNENKVSSEEKVDNILFATNWQEEIEIYKKELLSNSEHPDVDDATIILLEKVKPLEIQFEFSSEKEADSIWEQVSDTLNHFDYRQQEKKKLFFIIQELITNAAKYGKNGKIKIRLTPAWVIIKVEDEGEGFDINSLFEKTARERIEEFLQNNLDGKEIENFGIGLFLVKKYSYRFLYNKKGNIFISVVKKSERFTEYYSKYEG